MADQEHGSLYTYKANLVAVVDGDTIDLTVDLGFRTWHRDRFRLAGINAPERATEAGKAARRAAAAWFEQAVAPVYVQTLADRQEKYGRYLAWVYSGAVLPGWGAPGSQAGADAVADAAGDGCLNVALVRSGDAAWCWPARGVAADA